MSKGIGFMVLNFSVALYLFATGIIGITGRRFFTDGEIRRAVTSFFSGDFADILVVILSVLAIAAGVFILIKFFGISVGITELLLIILAITWAVFILMIDIVYPLNHRGFNFIDWLRSISSHGMVLAGITLATERFGG
jgi:sterol desaturase/sphingolipid hydroxylase (fatty acid hydroxylase superfamily)